MGTTFVDGPGKLVTLYLKRSPVYLRVVRDKRSYWINALDELGDRARFHEEIFAYQREWVGEPAQRGSETFETATYKLLVVQPSDTVMRNEESWQNWCRNKAAGEGVK